MSRNGLRSLIIVLIACSFFWIILIFTLYTWY